MALSIVYVFIPDYKCLKRQVVASFCDFYFALIDPIIELQLNRSPFASVITLKRQNRRCSKRLGLEYRGLHGRNTVRV